MSEQSIWNSLEYVGQLQFLFYFVRCFFNAGWVTRELLYLVLVLFLWYCIPVLCWQGWWPSFSYCQGFFVGYVFFYIVWQDEYCIQWLASWLMLLEFVLLYYLLFGVVGSCADEVESLVSFVSRSSPSIQVMMLSIDCQGLFVSHVFSKLFGRMNTSFNGWHLDCCIKSLFYYVVWCWINFY